LLHSDKLVVKFKKLIVISLNFGASVPSIIHQFIFFIPSQRCFNFLDLLFTIILRMGLILVMSRSIKIHRVCSTRRPKNAKPLQLHNICGRHVWMHCCDNLNHIFWHCSSNCFINKLKDIVRIVLFC